MGFIESGEMSVERILVLLNIREGIKEFLNLTYLGRTRLQILDYEGVPFHCRRWHEYEHIVKDYKSTMEECMNNRSTLKFRADGGIPDSLGANTPFLGSNLGGTTPYEPVVS